MPSIHALIVTLPPQGAEMAAPLTRSAAPLQGLWSYLVSTIAGMDRSGEQSLGRTLRAELGCQETPEKVRAMHAFIDARSNDNLDLDVALASLEITKVILGTDVLGAPAAQGMYQSEHISSVCLSRIARQRNGSAMLRKIGWTRQTAPDPLGLLSGLPESDFIHPFVLHPHLTLDRHGQIKAIQAFPRHFQDWCSALVPEFSPGQIFTPRPSAQGAA